MSLAHLHLLHGFVAVSVFAEHSHARGVGAPALASRDVPGVAHHELEVVIVVDGGGHVVVVVEELGGCDFSVRDSSHIECVQELSASDNDDDF